MAPTASTTEGGCTAPVGLLGLQKMNCMVGREERRRVCVKTAAEGAWVHGKEEDSPVANRFEDDPAI